MKNNGLFLAGLFMAIWLWPMAEMRAAESVEVALTGSRTEADSADTLRQKVQESIRAMVQVQRDLGVKRSHLQSNEPTCLILTKEISELQTQVQAKQAALHAALLKDAAYADLLNKKDEASQALRAAQKSLNDALSASRNQESPKQEAVQESLP